MQWGGVERALVIRVGSSPGSATSHHGKLGARSETRPWRENETTRSLTPRPQRGAYRTPVSFYPFYSSFLPSTIFSGNQSGRLQWPRPNSTPSLMLAGPFRGTATRSTLGERDCPLGSQAKLPHGSHGFCHWGRHPSLVPPQRSCLQFTKGCFNT